MDKKEGNDFPTIGCGIVAVLSIIVAFIILKSCVEGTVAFFETKGSGGWLAFITGLIIVTGLLMHITKRPD